MTNEQNPTLQPKRVTLMHKIFYWSQALVLFALVLAIGMAVLNWCLNLNLFWNVR